MKKILKMKKWFVFVMLGTMLCSLTACGGMKTSDSAAMDMGIVSQSYAESEGYFNDSYTNGSYDMIVEESLDAEIPQSNSGSGADVTTNRKLIRTVSMEVETENFESMIINVEDRVSAMGGYIESAYTYNGSAYSGSNRRYAEMTVRVPDADLESFVDQIAGISNVVSKSTTTEDITLEYVDTEGLKEMYIAEETSLLALLEKAETVEDISYLTSRLSEVRYNIENLESRLLKFDDLVEYATIHLYIEEVEVYTPVVTEEKTFWEEISEGFKASVQDIWHSIVRFVKNLIIDLPYIIRFFVIVGLIILAIRLIIVIIKKVIKNKKAKKAAKQNSALGDKAEGKTEADAKATQTEGVAAQTTEATKEALDKE